MTSVEPTSPVASDRLGGAGGEPTLSAKKKTRQKASAKRASARASGRKASETKAESAELIPRRWWWVLLSTGVLSIALGVVMAVVYSILYAIDEPGGMELPFVDEYPTVVEILLPPFFAFFIGGILAFLGEILRRGTMIRNGATNIAVFRPLHAAVHAAWIVPPFVAWSVAMPWALSQLVQVADAGQLATMDADSDAVFLIGVYGGLAALMTGAVAGSLFKKLWFLSAVRRSGAPDSPSAFWWSFSFSWRLDVWLVALGALLLGLAPLPSHFESAGGTAATLGGGAGLVTLGILTCTQYLKAGMPLGLGTSVTRANRSLPAPRQP